ESLGRWELGKLGVGKLGVAWALGVAELGVVSLSRAIIDVSSFSRRGPSMTMLDRMRRHKNWLKWSLAIVVLAFILLYIPDFMRNPNAAAGPSTVVASVEGHDITVGRFRRAYQQQLQAYRQAYGANMDERMLKQLGFEQRIIQQMLEEETAVAEAERLGI